MNYSALWSYLQAQAKQDPYKVVIELAKLIEAIVKSEPQGVKINNKYYDQDAFRDYLASKFWEYVPLTEIHYVSVQPHISGVTGQLTLEGKKRIKFISTAPVPKQPKPEKSVQKISYPYLAQKYFEVEPISATASMPELYAHQQEALEYIREYKHVTVQVPTGLGKTLIGILAIKQFGTPALIVVPTIALMLQWDKMLRKYGLVASKVCGEKWCTKMLGPLTIITYASARTPTIAPRLKLYRLVIFDEVHHVYAEETKFILLTIIESASYIIGLTATKKQEYEMGYAMQQALLPPKIEYYPADFKGTKLYVPLEVKFIPVPLTPETMIAYEKNETLIAHAASKLGNPSTWSKYLSSSDPELRKLADQGIHALRKRRAYLSNSYEKLSKAAQLIKTIGGQWLVFTETIKSAKTLHNMLTAIGIKSTVISSEVSSIARSIAFMQFKAHTLQVLISVIVLEEGIDLPDLSQEIWISTSRKTPRYMIQRIGRMTRPKPNKVAKLYIIYAPNTIEVDRIQELKNIV